MGSIGGLGAVKRGRGREREGEERLLKGGSASPSLLPAPSLPRRTPPFVPRLWAASGGGGHPFVNGCRASSASGPPPTMVGGGAACGHRRRPAGAGGAGDARAETRIRQSPPPCAPPPAPLCPSGCHPSQHQTCLQTKGDGRGPSCAGAWQRMWGPPPPRVGKDGWRAAAATRDGHGNVG